MNLKQIQLEEEIYTLYLINQTSSITNTTNQVTTTNNVTYGITNKNPTVIPLFKGSQDEICANFYENYPSTFPTSFTGAEIITIPKKVKRHINALPKAVWSKIDNNKVFAVEKCLDYVSYFTGTIFYDDDEDKWINLHSSLLNEKYKKARSNTRIYKNIINALTYSTNATLPVIEIKKNHFGTETYKAGEYSKSYRLAESFVSDNLENYTLTCPDLIFRRRQHNKSKLASALENKIAYNLMVVYNSIELPTVTEKMEEGNRLISINYKTKKGKILAKLSNRKKDKISNFKNKSFVEENLKQYNYLIQNGYFIPNIGNFKSGGRIVDSFNLMPSWIRALIKIEGEDMVEVDYRALHPNLGIKIYSGSTKYITHQKVSDALGIDVIKVKKAHLSFFNERISGMKHSVLFNYYQQEEPELLKKIIEEKSSSIFNHKITSMRMFKLEVEIMTEVIARLNSIGIYVLYIYDALGCKKSDQLVVQKIMNEVILEFGVFTEASI